jgi:hypothetical protein
MNKIIILLIIAVFLICYRPIKEYFNIVAYNGRVDLTQQKNDLEKLRLVLTKYKNSGSIEDLYLFIKNNTNLNITKDLDYNIIDDNNIYTYNHYFYINGYRYFVQISNEKIIFQNMDLPQLQYIQPTNYLEYADLFT